MELIKYRNKIWFNHSGGFFEETATLNGLFQESGWGYECGTNTINPVDNISRFMKYHIIGGLELINLMIDKYLWNTTNNEQFVNNYIIPIANTVLTHYDQHFVKNGTNGKMNIYTKKRHFFS